MSHIRVRKSLQNYGNKKYRALAVATEYPALVYRDERFDQAKPWEGFGRNELMVKVSRAVTWVPAGPILLLTLTVRFHGASRSQSRT